ncbi:MAG: fibronectin type III domain-containing protein, partial [Clostridiales bacterium]|nr:fibronectin type III domain-containing protein [Clostridiales bacterium]
MKRIISVLMSMIVFISMIAVPSVTAEAASNIKINGVDIGYAAKDYFSKNGKQCTCHNQGICVPETSKCNCKHVQGTAQCYGFALYCQNKLFGYNDVSKPKEFKNIGSIASGKLTTSNLKELISEAPIGSHIRTYYVDKSHCAHSMILIDKNDKGFTVAQANGSNNEEYSGHYKCRIGTAKYTWKEYVDSGYGCRGINFVKIPKNQISKPAQPTIKSAEPQSSSSIKVKWDAVSGATSYKVGIRKSGLKEEYVDKTTSGTSYVFNGLQANTTYYFR